MILFFSKPSEGKRVSQSKATKLGLKSALLVVSLLMVSTVGCTVGPMLTSIS
jgi:hypothetical protein